MLAGSGTDENVKCIGEGTALFVLPPGAVCVFMWGWGWYLQCRRPLYSAYKRLSLQRGVEDINKGNEKPHFGNLLAEVRNDISRWIFEHRGGFFLEYVLL